MNAPAGSQLRTVDEASGDDPRMAAAWRLVFHSVGALPAAAATRLATHPTRPRARLMTASALASLLVALPVSAAAANDLPVFDQPHISPMGDNTYTLETGDLNGDGLDDVAAAANDSWIVSLATGDGRLGEASPLAAGPYVGQIRLGDINGDGFVDVVGASWNELRTFLGDGAGGFGEGPSSPLGGFQLNDEDSLTLADFDADGLLDAAVTTYHSASETDVRVMVNSGAGAFVAGAVTTIPRAIYARDLRSWDLDLDGHFDLVAIGVARGATILRNAGDNTFSDFEVVGDGQYSDVEYSDIDGDGHHDLVLAGGGANYDSIRIYPGLGGGEFGTPRTGGYVDEIEALAPPIDIDGDGALDLITASIGGEIVIYHAARSGGTQGFPHLSAFQSNLRWDTSGRIQRPYLSIGNLNQDRFPDIVVSNSLTRGIAAMLQRPDDTTAPEVTGIPDRDANAAGWFSGPVSVSWTAVDDVDGELPSPPDTILDAEGADQAAVSEQVCDAAGNCATGTLAGINIDTTAPSLSDVVLKASPLPVGQTASLTAAASDALSGVAGGEYFLGADPGQGAGTAMTLDGTQLSAVVDAGATPGVYPLGVRSVDTSGNYSAVSTVYLVVYDPTAGFATGGGHFIPGGDTSDPGDALPGLDGTSKATFGFVVKYQNGQSTIPGGNLQFHYKAGDFHLASTGMDWLVVTNTNWAKFQGLGQVDGITGLVPFRVDARDSDTTGQEDRLVIRIWAPGANPDVDEPLYKATGNLTGGQIRIHTD